MMQERIKAWGLVAFWKRYALALFFLTGCASLTVYNPATERRELIFVSTSSEVTMGQNIHQQIVSEFKLSEDAEKIARLNRVAGKLANISDRQDYQYHFYLIDKKEINAFTTPGGNIYFFSGLFDRLKSDDEIAAVLAHEIGHCSARHTIKKFQASLGYNIISALIFSQVNSPSVSVNALSRATDIAMHLAMSAYSRKDEFEADKLGVKYLYLAGYDPNGMIKTLEILKEESQGDAVPLMLRTHPYLEDRIKTVAEEIKTVRIKYGDS